ncbi:hypothetical protein Pla110_12990 [Polystyrenella longa]|uniref:Uncharacterized protein n=1 Tax=Polystyrenella longa TaxID=2528007 RepID=A0A518CK35_9PLAN|nr:hypothetical protein [Polystyrenella longa]QDU79588.1 hypothetical protein Pla110_12990 [Polystyrenella longa]
MSRRNWMLPLLAVGVMLVWMGLNKWIDHRETKSVALGYVDAVMQCDKQKILQFTHPELRERAEQELTGPAFKETQKPDEYRIEIHHSLKTGPEDSLAYLLNTGIVDPKMLKEHVEPTMLINVIIEQNGYQMKPDIHLERYQDGIWYVTWIEGLEVDPRWLDRQGLSSSENDVESTQAQQHADDLRLATEELQEAFKDSPGVTIEPIR